MIPAQFDYARPGSLEDALRLLREREGEAKVLSGGYSLLPLLKLRLAQPGLLVDIRDISGLAEIVETDDALRIGGKTTHAAIRADATVQARYPLLADASGGIGDPQVRNWGTIGGSLAHADPAADWPAVTVAARASIVVRNADGERTIAARDFFEGPFQTAIGPDEILTAVVFPRPQRGSGGAYQKLERRAGDFATVGAAVQVRLDGAGQIAECGIGLTAVDDHGVAAINAERLLVGAPAGDDVFRRAADAAAAESNPVSDAHGPATYKRAMVAEMVLRALRSAVGRAMATE